MFIFYLNTSQGLLLDSPLIFSGSLLFAGEAEAQRWLACLMLLLAMITRKTLVGQGSGLAQGNILLLDALGEAIGFPVFFVIVDSVAFVCFEGDSSLLMCSLLVLNHNH